MAVPSTASPRRRLSPGAWPRLSRRWRRRAARVQYLLGAVLAPGALIWLQGTVLHTVEDGYPQAGAPLLELAIVAFPVGFFGARFVIGAFLSWAILVGVDTYLLLTDALRIVTIPDVIGWTAPQLFVAASCALAGFTLRYGLSRIRIRR